MTASSAATPGGLRLVRIEHLYRDEFDDAWLGDTLLLIPVSTTPAALEAACMRAKDRFCALRDQLYASPTRPTYPQQIDFKAHPDRVVGELLQEYEADLAAYNAWWRAYDQAQRRFDELLCDELPGACTLDDPSLEPLVTLQWGSHAPLETLVQVPAARFSGPITTAGVANDDGDTGDIEIHEL